MRAFSKARRSQGLRLRDGIIAGESGALAHLYDVYRKPLLTFASRLVRGDRREDAEDLVSDTIVAAILAIRRFDGRVPLKTWLLGIARKEYLSHRRRSERTEKALTDEEIPIIDPDHLSMIEQADLATQVRKGIAALSVSHAKALDLYYLQEMDITCIAAELGMTRNSTRVALHRARARLRSVLERGAPRP